MGRLDLRDPHRDEDYEMGDVQPRTGWSYPQMTVDDCIAVAEIGSDAWVAQELAAGRSGEERDNSLKKSARSSGGSHIAESSHLSPLGASESSPTRAERGSHRARAGRTS